MKNNFLLVLLLSSIISYSQKETDGNKSYDKLAYIDAIDIYEGVAAKGYKSKDLYEKLGNAYYFNGLLDKAKSWYDKLFELNEEIEPEYYFRYAQSLKAVKNYSKADEMMETFFKLTNDYRGEMYVKNKMYLNEIEDQLDKYKIEDAGINSKDSDYGSYFFNTKMYFVTSRKPKKIKNNIDKWTNQNYSNLMSVQFDPNVRPVYIDEETDEINSKYHESSLAFTKDGNTLYFTRNNFNKGKVGFDKSKTVLLKIYKATLKNKKWSNIIELPFNSNEYSVAHPTLSADEKTLYFSSDMPGGYGSSDIYSISINEDGTFGQPENLGPKINTKSRETFPYITDDDVLYFASDGHLGIGGLDVFKSKKDDSGVYSQFENIGRPVNSEKDDFAFSKSPFERIYFFSSNRDGGQGFDDIYKVTELPKPDTFKADFIVVDAIDEQPILESKISVFDSNYNLIKEIISENKAEFSLDNLRKDREYIIKIESEKYFTTEKRYKGSELKDLNVITMNPKFIGVDPGDDLLKLLGVNIYFDLDKYFIRPDAEVELAKIIDIMLKYPQLKIHIKSHTDSRQTEAYNMRLSNFRAKSTREYMIKKGVSPGRLTAKGYGESQLLNKCSDGIPCTRDEHQLNRRSEFIIEK
jgi:outer membrane protein OmpA-like peptidoglycan-associated protein/tetratricopeptide (TPR) repeat protein